MQRISFLITDYRQSGFYSYFVQAFYTKAEEEPKTLLGQLTGQTACDAFVTQKALKLHGKAQ